MATMQIMATWIVMAIGILCLVAVLALSFCWCVDCVLRAFGVQKILFEFIVARINRRMTMGNSLQYAIQKTAEKLQRVTPVHRDSDPVTTELLG